MSRNRYDVVIHGAGMVGLTLARALAPAGLRLGLIDARPVPRWRPEDYDLRVSAVTVASERILRALGVWDTLAARRVSPFRGIEVADATGGGAVSFDGADIGESHLGHIVENVLIQQALHEGLADHDQFTQLIPAAIAAIETDAEGVNVTLEDGRRLSTRLLVGADGAASSVRELAGIALRSSDYGQSGVVAAIRTERQHGEIARQRFLPGGPLALLPLADGRCSIVWSLPSDEAAARLQQPVEVFCAALDEASAGMLGRVLECGPRAAFPLRRMHAERYVGERIALIGDAAHVIHPLAGQGANLGFLDAAVLAEEILAAQVKGRDLGGVGTLRRYERRRRGHNLLMQSAMDGFHLLFGNRQPWLVLPRSLGLSATDRLPLAKGFFMRQAMGLGHDLPRLAQ